VLDPHALYQLSEDLPDLDRPVLVMALGGFVDAGNATRLAREYILGTLSNQVAATFDMDQLLDYRSRRPMMDFVEDHWESYDEPSLVLHALRDGAGSVFLMLAGPEPDLQWERFTAALLGLIDKLGIRLTVGFNAIPMAVPHSRPTGVTAHGTRAELIAGYEPWLQRVRVPAAATHLLEYRLGQHGRDGIGFAVHVPHYLAQTDYPDAADALLSCLSRTSGLVLPTDDLRSAAATVRADIDRQIADSDEARRLVEALEEQYDAYVRGRSRPNLLATAGPLPTAEELGAELERFLAEQAGPDQPPT
jgi:hypothetical protein